MRKSDENVASRKWKPRLQMRSTAIFPSERLMRMDIEAAAWDVIADMIFYAR